LAVTLTPAENADAIHTNAPAGAIPTFRGTNAHGSRQVSSLLSTSSRSASPPNASASRNLQSESGRGTEHSSSTTKLERTLSRHTNLAGLGATTSASTPNERDCLGKQSAKHQV
jgi:hypothetical protein